MTDRQRQNWRPLGAWLPPPVEMETAPTQTLSRLRWATLVLLLVPTLAAPTDGRFGLPSWMLLLFFAVYNLVAGWLRRDTASPALTMVYLLADLAAAGTIYFLGGVPGGPLLILIALVVLCTAVIMTLRGTIIYTAVAVVLTVAIEITFPGWSFEAEAIQALGARVVILGMVGAGMTIVARQLSIEQQAARFRRTEAERLAEMDQLRRDFIATVSHDLQTPLTAIQAGLGMLETNASRHLPAAERTLLTNARRNSERLGWLINDLIAINQLESGVMTLERRQFDLRATVVEAVSLVHPLFDEKQQPLALDIPEPLPVLGDSRRLEQVVLNMLINAHQHTADGTHIAISGTCLNDEVRLVFRDTGPGIPPDRLDGIFDRFQRLAPHGSGSGLGLAIARGLVEAHGGRIWAESAPGEGSAFHLCLPSPSERHEVPDVPEAARR